MADLLTKEETARAHAQGWCLEYVFDDGRWRLCILPLEIKGDVRIATTVVTNQAKLRDALCIRALQLIHQHNLKN